MKLAKTLLLGAALGVQATALAAEDMAAGKYEYMVACAVCHGESAMGAGPYTDFLKIAVPGLTGLKAGNDGVFPYLEVFRMVDGRGGVRAHGSAMPIWGDRYSADARGDFGVYGGEVVTRGRIAVLVDYLESVQE